MEKEPIEFGLGIELWVYDGPGGQGERWKRMTFPREAWELAYAIFDLMLEGRSIQLVRIQTTGVLYAVTIPGRDREMPWQDYLKEFDPERFQNR